MINMIKGIYAHRYFTIVDHCGRSSERKQMAGIAQGYPLSTYLFIIVQTVLLHDALSDLVLAEEPEYVVTRDLLYADDTLLV